MTPRVLNAAIRKEEIFYVRDPSTRNKFLNELIVKKAKTVTVKGQRKVKVLTAHGWIFANHVRRPGSSDWIELDGEGPMTWYLNA